MSVVGSGGDRLSQTRPIPRSPDDDNNWCHISSCQNGDVISKDGPTLVGGVVVKKLQRA